ncbi:MAG: hypothetical protein KIS68_02330 [Bauldia sp.]|nr:hypothetical protein [Bauldia sp.]
MNANAASAANLTGVWRGRYVYPHHLGEVSFLATLIETATRLSGTVSEPVGAAEGARMEATLAGDRTGSIVSFVKTYQDLARFPDPVEYNGTLSADGMEIRGTWLIRGHALRGTFVMARPARSHASVSRKVTERA